MRVKAPFTPREERFIDEYLIDLDRERAVVAAGYNAKNARSQAYQLLKRPRIAAEVKRRGELIAGKLNLTAESVLRDIDRIATKAENAREFGAAMRGRELLGKHLKMFSDRVEHTGANGGPMEFTEVRRTIIDPKVL